MKRLTGLFSLVAALLAFITTTTLTQAAIDTWTGGAGDGTWTNGLNWGGTAPVAGDSLIFTGVKRVLNTNTFSTGTIFNGITFQSPAGAFLLKATNATGNAVALTGDIVDNQVVVPEIIGLPLTLNNSINLNVVTNGSLVITNVISGANGITVISGGTATLGGINLFTGTVTVDTNSQLNVSSDANLGAVPAALTPGEIVLNNGALRTSTAFAVNTNRGILLGPGQGTIQVDSQATVTNSTVYNGIIADNGGSGGLTKLGFGVLTLGGSNTYTGPTVIQNGTLALNFAAATAPTNNLISTNSLTLGGANSGFAATNFAALTLLSKSGVTNKQIFNSTLVTFGGSVVQVATNNTASGISEVDLNLGSLTHNVGGTLVVVPPSSFGLKGNITTSTKNVNGILGGWATIGSGQQVLGITIGTNYACVDANSNIVNYNNYYELGQNGNIPGQTVYSISNGVSGGMNLLFDSTLTGDMVLDVDHTNGPGTLTDVNAIKWDRTDGNVTFIIGVSNTLRLGKFGGILKGNTSSGNTWLIGETAAAANGPDQNIGTLTAGGADNTPGEIVLDANNTSSTSGTLIIDSQITDNGTGQVTVVKAGVSSMKLRGHNTYTGGTYLLQGRLQMVGSENGVGTPDADAFGSGPIYVLPGAYLFPSGSGPTNADGSILPVTNTVFISGQGTAGEPLGAIRGSGGWEFNGPWTLIGDTILGGNGGASGPIAADLSGPFNLTFCSPLTVNGTVALASDSGSNSWSGTTTLTARNNTGANTFLSGNSEIIPNGAGAGNVIMNGFSSGTIQWNMNGFSETVNGLITTNTALSSSIINNGTNASTLTVGDNEQSGVFGGSISDGTSPLAFTKIGGGIESLTGVFNPITGPVNVNGGTLALSGSGISSSLNINITTNSTLDGSLVDNGLSASSIGVSGGTLVGRAAAVTIGTLGFTNSHLVTVLNPKIVNITTPALSTGGTTNIIDLSSIQGVVSYPTQFTVIQYSGSIGGAGFNFGLGTTPTTSTFGYVSNNVANSSVDIYLTGGPLLITWTAKINTNWDIATTANWSNATTSVVFHDQDSATMDDTAQPIGGQFLVDLTTTVTPAVVTVNNSAHNYAFGGSGKITGSSGLFKLGTGALLLTNGTPALNDDYSGGIVVDNGGTLIFGSTNSITGGINIKNGSTVVVTNLGNLASGNVINEGTLLFNANNDVVANNNINNLVNGVQDGSVIKTNTDIVTLGGSSSYQGLTIVQQGTLRAANARAFGGTGAGLNGNTVLTVTNGTIAAPGVTNTATLDIGGQTLQTATVGPSTVMVNGAGVNGLGAITNSGALNQNALLNVTLAGNTTFGGGNRWDIRTVTGNNAQLTTLIDTIGDTNAPYTLTKVGTNQVTLVACTVGNGIGNIVISNGIFGVETLTTPTVGENLTHTIRVLPGATFELFNNSVGVGISKPLILNGDATGTNATVLNTSGTNTITTTINLNSGTNVFSISGTSLTLADDGSGHDTLFGAGTLLKSGGSRLFVNIPVNYTGNTIVSNGLMILNTGIGNTNSISTNYVGGGTLSGEGWFGGPVIMLGGNLSPGDTNITGGAPDFFNLVISNSLTMLGGTLVMDTLKTGPGAFTGDFITNLTALTIGGTLQLNGTTNGSPLAIGDAIPIFSTNGITPAGSFSAFVPSRPGTGLAWDQSTIAGDGKIRIQIAPTTPPVITGFSLSSRTNLVISATNGSGNATIKILMSTNVAKPLSSWTSVGTAQFNNNGNLLNFTNIGGAFSTNSQQQFYLLQEQ